MRLAKDVAALFSFTRAIVNHGEDYLKVNRLDPEGKPTSSTDDVKIGFIKFDNGSRIIAFSAHPQAMAVHSGDVGLDEFAKHPNAELLWQTAQGRVTWSYDLSVWSSHLGDNTLFNQFAQQARAGKPPWNLYCRVTNTDAIENGLLEAINRTRGSNLNPAEFLANCKARAGLDAIFEQTYMCNPLPGGAAITDWSAIERCRHDYPIERIHLESDDVLRLFGHFDPAAPSARESKIHNFLRENFPVLLGESSSSPIENQKSKIKNACLGFDIAASGEGDLCAFYFDEPKGPELWLRALLTVRTEDWHFLKTVLFYFLHQLPHLRAAGDESGLGRQICWEAAKQFPTRFQPVNFSSKKHDLGFSLMNQLSVAEKRFPKCEHDIAADYFALRKVFTGNRWIFTEGRNAHNPASHCDIAWAGALATCAHATKKSEAWALAG